jgi:hypothetical protein
MISLLGLNNMTLFKKIFTVTLVASLYFLVQLQADEIAQILEKKIIKEPWILKNGDSVYELNSSLKLETAYGRNLRLLNYGNPTDQTYLPGRMYLDTTGTYQYGQASHDHTVIKTKMTFRTKYVFGSPESIAPTDNSTVKISDVVTGQHYHNLNRLYLWTREASFDGAFNKDTHLTIGLFPFELGRGIALGSAYAVDLSNIGYYTTAVVDQYAPGIRLSGVMPCWKNVNYDLYAEMINCKESTWDDTNDHIRGQEYGHKFNQARGFGISNYLFAGRLKGNFFKAANHTITVEPYILVDNQKEQRVRFLGDASALLATVGLSFEGIWQNLDFGFEIAQNIGRQNVKGVDRNVIKNEIRNGIMYEVNSDVTAVATLGPDTASQKAVYYDSTQEIINHTFESEASNGEVIYSHNAPTNFKSSATRFTNPYRVIYGGNMFVADGSYKIKGTDTKFSLAGAYASGDENPHKILGNGLIDNGSYFNYDGFVGLQELYSGKRVKSVLLLSGAGRIPRMLSIPVSRTGSRGFADTVSRFNNIMSLGCSAETKLSVEKYLLSINPNILMYWQPHAAKRYQALLSSATSLNDPAFYNSRPEFISQHLGTEANIILNTYVVEDLNCFLTMAVFYPGAHYHDVKGTPISKEQAAYLDRMDRSGVSVETEPLVGENPAYFFNLGFTYKY